VMLTAVTSCNVALIDAMIVLPCCYSNRPPFNSASAVPGPDLSDTGSGAV
jgi:hypothetical protein